MTDHPRALGGRDLTNHPRAETLASFLEGTLPPPDLAEVAAHLRECGECRVVVAESARFEREGAEVRPAESERAAERQLGEVEAGASDRAELQRGDAETAEFERVESDAGELQPAEAEAARFTRGDERVAEFQSGEPEPARFERGEPKAARSKRGEERAAAPRPRTVRWWWAAAAAIVALIATPLLLRRDGDPRAQLIAAAPREHRLVEARLSGFPWARLQPPTRGAADLDPADLKLTGAAGDVLASTAAPHHARGTALLLIGHYGEAVTELEGATAAAPDDARAWNDLAAARDALAVSEGRASSLPAALDAVDRALALDARSPAALFNRALILEHLGRQADARSAWERYLAADGASPWSVEARARLAKLAAGP